MQETGQTRIALDAQLLTRVTGELAQVESVAQLEQLKNRYLGKKGLITERMRQLGELAPAQRSEVGQQLNQLKRSLLSCFQQRHAQLTQQAINASLQQEAIDVTLPARQRTRGSHHPISIIRRKLEDFFVCMGFAVVDGPEVEDEFHNFTALNIPAHHPARSMHDTFYLADLDLALRSQTSSVQIRALEECGLPLRMICPGRVFRRDSDATHSPMFHQMELLMVDRELNFAQLRWLIMQFVEYMFGPTVQCRFRSSYFPFTEPSAEVDIQWRDAQQRPVWLEVGGCGMVHPQVFKYLNLTDCRGFAFGFGLDRLAMVYYQISDIRELYQNNAQFLRQF